MNKLLLRTSLLLILLPVLVFVGLNIGDTQLSVGEIFQGLFASEGGREFVILEIRLPRVLMALLAGALLSIGGFLMQALVKNPLADPYILGLSSGAALGVNFYILVIGMGTSAFFLPFWAFAGAGISLAFLMLLGYRSMYEDSSRLLIAGIAISSLFTALTSFLIYAYAENNTWRSVISWTFGNFNGILWSDVITVLFLLLLTWGVALLLSNRLDILSLGDRQAQSLGLGVPQLKLIILGITAVGVGGMIAFTGPIGFIGMMIPHFSRSLNGMNHRKNLIFGPILGAAFLCLCDILAQVVYPPAGLPIGVVTAIAGVPFFLYILFASKFRI